MAVSYINNTNVVYQPQLVRWRARYRGPRESYKINLEMQQIRYDLLQLNSIADGIENNLTNQLNEVEFGVNITDLGFTTTNSNTSTGASQDVAARVQNLMRHASLLVSNFWGNNFGQTIYSAGRNHIK